MITYHLSHIDLDGFFCQYLSTLKYKNVKYYNSNYGKEIYSNLKKIFKEASLDSLILITDLNLDSKECEYIQSFVDKGYNVKLYDHHISGERFSKKFDWYYLDITKSASLILSEKEDIDSTLVNYVNSYDLWIENEYLDLGCHLSEFINKDFIFYFNEDKIKYFINYFSLLEIEAKKRFISFENIGKLEKLEVKVNQEYFRDLPGTIKQKLSFKFTQDMFKTPIRGKYLFLFNINREFFQYISQILLKENPNLIIVLISKNGRLSFRSKIEDVNELSTMYFYGSGHKNAAGGSLKRDILTKAEGIDLFLSKI